MIVMNEVLENSLLVVHSHKDHLCFDDLFYPLMITNI